MSIKHTFAVTIETSKNIETRRLTQHITDALTITPGEAMPLVESLNVIAIHYNLACDSCGSTSAIKDWKPYILQRQNDTEQKQLCKSCYTIALIEEIKRLDYKVIEKG